MGRGAGRHVRAGGGGRAQGATVDVAVVAPVGARGHGSPQGGQPAPPLMVCAMALARWCGGPGRRRGIPVAETPSLPEFLSQKC